MNKIIINTKSGKLSIVLVPNEVLAQIEGVGDKWLSFKDIGGVDWLVNTDHVETMRIIEDYEEERSPE